jgi:hypothetical protein
VFSWQLLLRKFATTSRNSLIHAVAYGAFKRLWGTMLDVQRIKLLRAKSYAKRAEECRALAKVGPEHLREGYLDLAAQYERLAKEAEK